ncbi:MAG: hypothetical protein ABI537_05635 [Casimicrobiaceae bacterium]
MTTATPATPPPIAVKAAASAAAATIATASRPAYVPPPPAAAAPPRMTAMGNTVAPGALPPDPALVQAPKSRLGLIAALLAVVAILGIGTFVAYKMFFSKDATPPVVTSEPAKSDTATVSPMDAGRDGSAATGQGSNSNMSAPPGSPADAAQAAAEAAKAATPVTPPTPADAAAAKAAAAKSAAAAARAEANKAPPVGGAPSVAPPVAAPAPAVQHTPPQAAVVQPPQQVDRWGQMRQAYALCDREGFFDKLACNSRVGNKYCEGYWGKVPQCPVGAYGDRAN